MRNGYTARRMELASLQPGARVGQYVIERQVAVGGSAVVYQARDPRARRNVAVKVLGAGLANGSDGGRRLLNEAGVVCTPGAGFGRCGEGYIRISAFNSAEKVDKAMEKISKVLG